MAFWILVLIRFAKDEVAKGKQVVFEKVNCEEKEEIANDFGVRAYPTFFLVRGKDRIEYTQALTKEGVRDFLNKHCS